VKLTRRQLVVAAAAATNLVAQALSPALPSAQQENADALAKFSVPMTTEPAFQFKA
jgi:hypothetical protein